MKCLRLCRCSETVGDFAARPLVLKDFFLKLWNISRSSAQMTNRLH